MITSLVIDRGQWLTGTALKKTTINGELRHKETGLQCCVGIYGTACRMLNSEMNGRGLFEKRDDRLGDWLFGRADVKDLKGFKIDTTTVQDVLARVNDSSLHPIRKEAKLKKLFKKYGNIDVTFVGKYAEATAKARKAARQNA